MIAKRRGGGGGKLTRTLALHCDIRVEVPDSPIPSRPPPGVEKTDAGLRAGGIIQCPANKGDVSEFHHSRMMS